MAPGNPAECFPVPSARNPGRLGRGVSGVHDTQGSRTRFAPHHRTVAQPSPGYRLTPEVQQGSLEAAGTECFNQHRAVDP